MEPTITMAILTHPIHALLAVTLVAHAIRGMLPRLRVRSVSARPLGLLAEARR